MAATGTVTFTETTYTRCKRIKIAWTSGAAGTVTEWTTANPYDGKVIWLVTVPGTGADQPDDNYNVTLLDPNGIDVLAGAGLLRDETNTEYVASASLGCAVGPLTVAISSAGAALKGTVYVYIMV